MAEQGSKKREVKLRVPIGTHDVIQNYAKARNMTLTQAYLYYLNLGIQARADKEQFATKDDFQKLATKDDFKGLIEAVSRAIKEQPIVVQGLPTAEPGEVGEHPTRWARLKAAWRNE